MEVCGCAGLLGVLNYADTRSKLTHTVACCAKLMLRGMLLCSGPEIGSCFGTYLYIELRGYVDEMPIYSISPARSQFCAKCSSKASSCCQVRNLNPAFCLFLGLLPLSRPSPCLLTRNSLHPPTTMLSIAEDNPHRAQGWCVGGFGHGLGSGVG